MFCCEFASGDTFDGELSAKCNCSDGTCFVLLHWLGLDRQAKQDEAYCRVQSFSAHVLSICKSILASSVSLRSSSCFQWNKRISLLCSVAALA